MQAVKQQIKLLVFRLFRRLYKKRLFKDAGSQPEFLFLAAFLKLHPLFFIDVGANKGEFIYVAAKHLTPVKIWAFEPLPYFAAKLKALFRGITVFNLGLSEQNGQTTLYVPVKNNIPDDSLSSVNKPARGVFNTYAIELRTLDSLALEHGLKELCFLKIDVEGHEFSVLSGGANFIKNQVRAMLVEIEERHHIKKKLADMIGEIENSGFTCYYLHPEKKQLVLFSESPDVQQKEEDLNTPFYVNNFWFFAKQFNPKSVVASLNQTLS